MSSGGDEEKKLLQRLHQDIRELMESVARAQPVPELMTQPQAAKALSISMSKLRSLIRQGHVRAVRLGGTGHPMVSLDEIRRAIAEWTIGSPSSSRPFRPVGERAPVFDADAEIAKAKAAAKRRR